MLCFAMLYAGSNCKQLQQLLMADAKRVEDSGLIAVSCGCSSLEVLGKLCYTMQYYAILCYTILHSAMRGSYMFFLSSLSMLFSTVLLLLLLQCSALLYSTFRAD
jgi:hypothetical protein